MLNATTTDRVQAALKFARDHGARLVIKGTGHDLLGRSDYGITLSPTVKAHPNVDVVAMQLLSLPLQPSPTRPTQNIGPSTAPSPRSVTRWGTPRPSRRGAWTARPSRVSPPSAPRWRQ
ncbi:hypothetical protein DL771_008018 [Monosporascus sp. 5C6A]|nr:hypothetical protein DL771_008018 [Monosporascus sp. 5C6A]